MGAWGARIYEDDEALDIRADFRERLAAGEAVAAIEAAILEEYQEDDSEVGDNDVLWLALCCAELETGTLTSKVKRAALEVIASGRQYTRWLEDAGAEDAALRKRELTLVRKYIETYAKKPIKRKSWLALRDEDVQAEPPAETPKLPLTFWLRLLLSVVCFVISIACFVYVLR